MRNIRRCEECGSKHRPKILETREHVLGRRIVTKRRKMCVVCGHRHNTIEIAEEDVKRIKK